MKASKYDLASFELNEEKTFTEKASTVAVSVAVFKRKNAGWNFKVTKLPEGCKVLRIA